ncbi:DUF2182 domain-containing protein [Mucilaginibacter sabulilitoris]|uniref:DUF2182 domain-containing protein n=1 Tax=Mucilaginibacter sabulilitoris TaxID=1173583 RepID=A0ABZ0TIT6_9SPHI|nr:DUF2182 domain-containing protein [Mucilaginibacter sabulilitoris]WPU91624.1 DUF2182 domain-containing protein [Mucilaginibacter sabulilitoris]
MTTSRKTRTFVIYVILTVSAAFWVLLLMNSGSTTIGQHLPVIVPHCPIIVSGESPVSLQALLAMNPISSLMIGWVFMVMAMMLPTLIIPILYICERSFKHRRLRSALIFAFGYVGIWVTAGVVMIAVTFGLRLLMPKLYLPAIVMTIAALVWQFSPIKQRCLNSGHNHKALAAFGLAADRDALIFGVLHGLSCVGSGWALMLFPMLLPVGHHLVMIVITLMMIGEHLEHPQPPRWRFNLSGKLLRILIAQIQIRLITQLNMPPASNANIHNSHN